MRSYGESLRVSYIGKETKVSKTETGDQHGTIVNEKGESKVSKAKVTHKTIVKEEGKVKQTKAKKQEWSLASIVEEYEREFETGSEAIEPDKHTRLSQAGIENLSKVWEQSQGTLATELKRNGVPITARQIARLVCGHMGIREKIERGERNAKDSLVRASYYAGNLSPDSNLDCETDEIIADEDRVTDGVCDRESTYVHDDETGVSYEKNLYDDEALMDLAEATRKAYKYRERELKPSVFKEVVDWLTTEISQLPEESQTILATAYFLSARAPRVDRDDVQQEIVVCLLNAIQKYRWNTRVFDDGSIGVEHTGFAMPARLAYYIGHCTIANWWQRYMRRSQHSFAPWDTIIECEQRDEPETDDPLEYVQDKLERVMKVARLTKAQTTLVRDAKHLEDNRKQTEQDNTEYKRIIRLSQGILQASVEFDYSCIDEDLMRTTLKKLPEKVRKLVLRLTGKYDSDGHEIVKRTRVLSPAEDKALERYSKTKGCEETLTRLGLNVARFFSPVRPVSDSIPHDNPVRETQPVLKTGVFESDSRTQPFEIWVHGKLISFATSLKVAQERYRFILPSYEGILEEDWDSSDIDEHHYEYETPIGIRESVGVGSPHTMNAEAYQGWFAKLPRS